MNLRLSPIASVVALCACLLLIGCGIFERHQTVSASGQTNTSYTVSAGVTNALATAREITQQVPGWGGIATVLLACISGVLGLIAKAKSDKAALVPALITGIEAAEGNDQVKRSVEKVARAAGLEGRLNATVRKITR